MRRAVVLAFFLVAPVLCWAANHANQISTDPQSFYEAHHCFALRDALGTAQDTTLYQGIVANAFNDPAGAETLLHSAIQSAPPKSKDATAAWQELEYLYQRGGRQQRLRAIIQEQIARNPNDPNLKTDLATASGFLWNQSTANRRATEVPYKMIDGNVLFPVSINGTSGEYIMDTDANMSVISESEAKRVGLTVRDVGSGSRSLSGATGIQIRFRTTDAADFVVGNVHLKHVSFLVLPDRQEPFVDLPLGERAVIGLPVLVAFQTIRWTSDGTLEIAFPPSPRDVAQSNLCFDGMHLITLVVFQKRKLDFIVDTGDNHSDFFPLFAKDFSDLLQNSGTKQSSQATGFDGSKQISSVSLPEITMGVGGFTGTLSPARILTEQTMPGTEWFYGRVGMGFLRQARGVSIDFRAMTLSLN